MKRRYTTQRGSAGAGWAAIAGVLMLTGRLTNPPGTPLLEDGDTVGMIIKVIPNNGTTTGVGGYVDFYAPRPFRPVRLRC
jgi:hypothetical protein